MSILLGAGGSDVGSSNIDRCLGNMYLLETFLHNSEVVDVFVFISALQIRKLVLKEGMQLTHNVRQGTCLRRQTDLAWGGLLALPLKHWKLGAPMVVTNYMAEPKGNLRPRTSELGLWLLLCPTHSQGITLGPSSQGPEPYLLVGGF